MPADTVDVAVVGLGAVGSALCHYLSARGARVVGFDRFHPPHDQGSSHGLTRITRLAIGEGDVFVPLVLRAHLLWRELEARSGVELYRATGGLIIAEPDSDAHAFHGRAGFFARTLAAAQRFGIEHECLDAAAIRRRFPAFAVGDRASGYYEPAAGLLFPERCVEAHLDAARRLGADLRFGEPIAHVDADAASARVASARSSVRARRVVLAAGAWTSGLAGPRFASRLRVLRQVLYWFETGAPELYAPPACPVFVWLHGAQVGEAMYGMPMADGVPGVKIATEQAEVESDPDRVARRVDAAEVEAMYAHHVNRRLRGIAPRAVRTATCLYTSTADGGFIVEPHPDSDAVTVVSACSGHGFKHSPALAEALAQRIAGEPGGIDLAPFDRGGE